MASLFGFAAVVQFNDPDPIRWMAVYGAACALCVLSIVRGAVPPLLALAAAAAAFAWAVSIVAGGPGASEYGRMFDGWEMRSVPVEEAREATGLLLMAGWMTVLGSRGMRGRASRAGRVEGR